MGHETEWFAGRKETGHERCVRWRVGFWLFALLVVALFLLPLIAGCSSSMTAPLDEICYMQALGKTEDNWTVVAQRCLTPEAFTESQK